MLKRSVWGAIACVGFALVLPGKALAGNACLVADPTGTPLNARLAPNAKIVGAINNGVGVRITNTTYDSRGRAWVHIVYGETGGEIGWVFKQYLDCRD